MLGSICFVTLLSLASATVLLKPQVVIEKAVTKHTLRVCNAYPSSHDLRVLKNNNELKGKSQMKYKECIELDGPLKEGDRLNFEASSVPLGTFTVGVLPDKKSTLVLVAFRESKVNTKIAFMSHTFEARALAQLAVIDTFQGKTKSDLSISQFQDPNNAGAALSVQDKELEFNTAMELEAGAYQVKIATGATRQIKGPFVVAEGETYVLLRTGLDDAPSPSPSPPPISAPQETQNSGTGNTSQRSEGAATGSTGDFFLPSPSGMNLLAEHSGTQEQISDTTGTNFFSNSANVNLMAEHAGKQEQEVQSSTGTNLFAGSNNVRLLAMPAGSGTSGPGIGYKFFPDTQEPSATGGLTEGAERGESLEQFLGLVSEPIYPQEFVVYPLLKPALTQEKKQEQEHSGASAVGPTAVLFYVAVLSALLT